MEKNMEIQTTGDMKISLETIKQYIFPTGTHQELAMFLTLCKTLDLNPFVKEVYAMKYGTSPATFIVSKDAYLKYAKKHQIFGGHECGVILLSANNQIIRTNGIVLPETTLIGGWATIHFKDGTRPFQIDVNLKEYIGLKPDGTPNKTWEGKPATMIQKVALVHAIRNAFPFGSDIPKFYDESEVAAIRASQDGANTDELEQPIILETEANEIAPQETEFRCSKCEVDVPQNVANYSRDKFKTVLCFKCQRGG